MVDLSLDLNDKLSPTYRDLLVLDGDLVLTTDGFQDGQAPPQSANPVMQDILQRLRFGLGEWFMDNTQGFPWIQQVFAKGTNQGQIDALIQDTILGTPGVDTLLEYGSTVDRKARVISLSFTAHTTSGKVSYSGTLSPTSGG